MKSISILLVVLMLSGLFLTGCGQDKRIGKHTYTTYGLLNQSDKKNPNVDYDLIIGNLVWGCLLFGTIAAPVYFFGFSLFEPVRKKNSTKPLGTK